MIRSAILEEVRRMRGRLWRWIFFLSFSLWPFRIVLLAHLHIDYITFLSTSGNLENVDFICGAPSVTPAR